MADKPIILKDCAECKFSFIFDGILHCELKINNTPGKYSQVTKCDCIWYKKRLKNET